MATVIERTTAAGERRLYVVFRAKDRDTGKARQFWELVPTPLKKEANGLKADVESGLRRNGGYWPLEEPKPEEETAPLTFAEFAHWWIEERLRPRLRDGKITQRVFDGYRNNIRRYLLPKLGDVELTAIDAPMILDVLHELAGREVRPIALSSMKSNVLTPLRLVLAAAVKQKQITFNPAATIEAEDVPGRAPKDAKCPTPDELQRILDAADEEAREIITVAASEGLGIGEVFGLLWGDVLDPADPHSVLDTVTVRRQNTRGVIVERTKTKTRKRLIPLFPTAKAVLEARRERLSADDASPWTLPFPDTPIFSDAIGRPENPDNWRRRVWDPTLANAGLADVIEREGRRPLIQARYDFHELRKYANTQLIAQGATDSLRKQVLGHAADSELTDTVYAPVSGAVLASAATGYDPLR